LKKKQKGNKIEFDYELKRKEIEAEYFRKQVLAKAEQEKKDELAKAEINRQRIIRNSVIGGLVILLLFLVVVYRQRNKIKKGKKLSDEFII